MSTAAAAEPVRAVLRKLRYAPMSPQASAIRASDIARFRRALEPDTIERRIFEECEVRRRPFKCVAADLSISVRQLYRLRARMECRIVHAFEVAQAIAVEPFSIESVHLDNARRLFEFGRYAAAADALAATEQTSISNEGRVEALALRARLFAMSRSFREAAATIDEGFRLCERLKLESPIPSLWMARSHIAYVDGRYQSAIELADRALAGSRTARRPEAGIRRLARHQIELAVLHEESESPRESLRILDETAALLSTSCQAPVETARLLCQRALTQLAIPDQLSGSEETALAAVELGARSSDPVAIVWANIALALTCEQNGRLAEGLGRARAALCVARASLAGDLLVRAFIFAARLEATAGDTTIATHLLDEAESHARENDLLTGVVLLCKARLGLRTGDRAFTILAAGRAIAMREGRSVSHYTGIAYYARARSHEGGSAPLNFDDVERALFYLEKGGDIGMRVSCLELAYRVTKDGRFAAAAAELRAYC